MQILGSVESMIASIRDEANAELEKMREERGAARVPARPPAAEDGRRSTELAAERKRNEERLAQAEWEERRHVIEQRESWIVRVIARGNEILAQRDDATIARLAEEARQSIRGGEVTVEPAPGGGCIVRSGALVVDNSFAERAKRLEFVWRKALADLYRI